MLKLLVIQEALDPSHQRGPVIVLAPSYGEDDYFAPSVVRLSLDADVCYSVIVPFALCFPLPQRAFTIYHPRSIEDCLVDQPLCCCLRVYILVALAIFEDRTTSMAQINDRSGRDALQRLNQTLLQIDPYILPPYPNLSIVSGPLSPPLLQLTLSQLLYQQVELYPNNEAIIISWTGARWTYQKLWDESSLLARALLKYGVRPRDRVGIMSGNCERYIALFFACARVGAICVTLNNTYTATEMEYALKHTSKSSKTLKCWRVPS
jgi:hypothetical protein